MADLDRGRDALEIRDPPLPRRLGAIHQHPDALLFAHAVAGSATGAKPGVRRHVSYTRPKPTGVDVGVNVGPMTLTRRSFFLGSSLAALAAPRLLSARGLLTEPTLDAIVKRALAAATKAGATYADIRIVRHRRESVRAREDKV